MAKSIRFGIVGTNFISDNFANAAAHCEITLQAVYSRKADTGQAFAQKYGIPDVYTDFDAFVKADTLDAIYVASPNYAHCPQSITAMENGKHVLCEKPVASNLKELGKMIAASRANNVVFMEGMILAHEPAYKTIAQNLPKIGKVRHAYFEMCKYSSRYDQFKKGIVQNVFNPALSNAAIMDIGVYCIHPCVKLFGKPQGIKATSVILENGMEGCGTVTLQYPDMIADTVYSKITETGRQCVIQGEDGAIVYGGGNPTIVTIVYRNGEKEEIEVTKGYPNMTYELLEFIRLVREGEIEHGHLQYSKWSMQVIDEARRQNGVVFPADL